MKLVHGICSNKIRPTMQGAPKGNQWWRKEAWHIRECGLSTLCGRDASEWLDMRIVEIDQNLCSVCRKKAINNGVIKNGK